MNTRITTTLIVLLLCYAVILPASAQLQYTVTDLGVLNDVNGNPGMGSYANQINNAGQVVGATYFNSGTVGWLWDSGTLIGMDQTPGSATATLGNGINNSGQIAGSKYLSAFNRTDAIIWERDGSLNFGVWKDLFEPSGDAGAAAFGINDAGQAVGDAWNSSGSQAFVYGPSTFFSTSYSMIGIGTLGGNWAVANGINNNDVIFGEAALSSSAFHAFVSQLRFHRLGIFGFWRYDMNDLDGGLAANTSANGGNDHDQIVGVEYPSGGNSFPVLYQWNESTNSVTSKTGLPVPYFDASYYCAANSINNNGVIVGQYSSSLHQSACLWDQPVGPYLVLDLNFCIPSSSGWHLQNARSINDKGQIVGSGLHFGVQRAFLLNPIETSSLAFGQNPIPGGASSFGTVTLNAPAVINTYIQLSSSNPAVAAVPSAVVIPAGSQSATFAITTHPVASSTNVTITAKDNGVSLSAPLTVRPIGVKSLALAPNPVIGGISVTGTVTLEAPAGPGSITVTLSSSNSAIASPTVSSITIPAGSQTGAFIVKTAHIPFFTHVTINATANGIAQAKSLTIDP